MHLLNNRFYRHLWNPLIFTVLCLFSTQVNANNKIALVVGAENYQGKRLETAAYDIQLVTQKLANMGFKVTTVNSASSKKMDEALKQFANSAKQAQIAVFYYSGYGIQVDNINYLLPEDLNPNEHIDLEKLPRLSEVTKAAAFASQLGLLVVDASYKNPFSEKIYADIGRDAGGAGLAEEQHIPQNVIVAYAAQAEEAALDQQANANSFFAEAFLKQINATDDIRVMLSNVKRQVLERTASQQTPENYESLGDGTFCLSCIELADQPFVPKEKDENVLPPAKPAPDETEDLIEKMRKKLMAGNIQFDVPKRLNIKEENPIPIKFSLDLNELKKDFNDLAKALGKNKEKSLNKPITVIAKLTGQNFEIIAISEKRREILESAPNEWSWSIQPKEVGTHSLYLSVSVISPISGEPVTLFSPKEKYITITENPFQWGERIFDKHAEMIVTGILSALVSSAVYLLARRKKVAVEDKV